VRTALIGGIGNVLLGDDGVGPYIVRLLASQYSFGDDVELADLGTPALDLTHQIVGLRALILVDSVAGEEPPGTVKLFHREDILRVVPAERLDPHSPALSECLLAAEMLGATPKHVLLVGIAGESYGPGEPLSAPVREAVEQAVNAVLLELLQMDYSWQKKAIPSAPDIWWSENYHAEGIPSRG